MNYYEILKVSKTATDQEIKNSYKTLVKKYHPDLYVGDKGFAEQKIKEINEAYDILSNPETKAEYDEYLNPQLQPSVSYDKYNPSSAYQTDTKQYTDSPPHESKSLWTFNQFISDKFNKLDKKRQVQIFIIILVSVLALFLINLIEVQYYLKNHNNTTSNSDKTQEKDTIVNHDFTNKTIEDEEIYEQNDFETLDDLFYDLFEIYEDSLYNSNTLYENTTPYENTF